MTKKLLTRILAFVLMIVMVVPVLAACTETKQNDPQLVSVNITGKDVVEGRVTLLLSDIVTTAKIKLEANPAGLYLQGVTFGNPEWKVTDSEGADISSEYLPANPTKTVTFEFSDEGVYTVRAGYSLAGVIKTATVEITVTTYVYNPDAVYTYHTSFGSNVSDWSTHTNTASFGSTLAGYMYTPFYDWGIDYDAEIYDYSNGQKLIYAAAVADPIDITADLAAEGRFGLEVGDASYAWKIPLRAGMKWDNGDPITAQSYVDSMEILLSPEWKTPRASGHFSGTGGIRGAEAYYKGQASFSEVGYYCGTEEDGSEYIVAVYMLPHTAMTVIFDDPGSYYLVHKATYMSTKTETSAGSGVYKTNYNKASDWQNTRSHGPYVMTSYASNEIMYSRNPHWFGYTDMTYRTQFDGAILYQTTNIHLDMINGSNASELSDLMFRQGKLEAIGVNIDYMANYSNSIDRWRSTDTDSIWWVDITSDIDALEAINAAPHYSTENATLLAIPEFRLALSAAIDRQDLVTTTTAGNKAWYTLLSSVNFIDMEYSTSLFYRDTLPAKTVIAELYQLKYEGDAAGSVYNGGSNGVYRNIDEAITLTTGYDIDLAVELLNIAYDKATNTANPDYNARYYNSTKNIILNLYVPVEEDALTGNAALARRARKLAGFMQTAIRSSRFAKGNGSNITVTAHGAAVDAYEIYDFMADGEIEMMLASVSGGGGYSIPDMLAVFLDEYYQGMFNFLTVLDYTTLELTIDGETMTLEDWYLSMWDIIEIPLEERTEEDMELLTEIGAALELAVLQTGSYIPVYQEVSVAIYSKRINISSIMEEYNSFYGYGGLKNYTYAYTDAQWDAYVNAQGGTLTY